MAKDKVELQGFDVEVTDNSTIVVGDVDTEIAEQESIGGTMENQTIPDYGSDEWNDFVMSLFRPDELFNGNPLTAGLRRVATQLLGPIVSSKPVNVFPSMDPNGPGRATVIYEIIIDFNNSGDMRVFGDVGEVWHGNTDDLFCAHATATACTKAEGRCLRKALMVKCLAAEELPKDKDAAAIVRSSVKIEAPTTGEMNTADKISDNQIKFIDGKCKQLNIDPMKFINSMSDTKYEKIGQLNKKVASDIIQALNREQQAEKKNPDVVGYDPRWMEK